MASNSQHEAGLGNGNAPLEDRLRGLILKNSQSTPSSNQALHGPVDPGVPQFPVSTINLQHGVSPWQSSSEIALGLVPSGQTPHGGRKRLNQAQRRQMNAQMSVPIGPPPVPQETQRGRGFSPSTGFTRQRHSSGPTFGQQDRSQFSQHQYPTTSSDSHPASFLPPQPPNRRQNAYRGRNQGRVLSPTGYGHQSTSTQQGARPANRFTENRAQGQHSVLALDRDYPRPIPQHGRLYQPGPYVGRGHGMSFSANLEHAMVQSVFLDVLLEQSIPKVRIGEEEIQEKERFRVMVEQVCRDAIMAHEKVEKHSPNFDASSIELKCFGSIASGFATKASDMDLALLTPHSEPPPDSPESSIPRLLEKKLLDMGFGARLLTKTRVPIIKLCQKPTEKLMHDLQEERKKWEVGFATNEADEVGQKAEDIRTENMVDEKTPKEALKGESVNPSKDTYRSDLASLVQKANESLVDYYGSACRLLRRLGGRDLDSSYEIPPEQTKVLMDVCKAFVKGLSDAGLSARLCRYQSLMLSDTSKPTITRSLRGIYIQVEGEQLAMAWDSRPLFEPSDRLEADGQVQIDEWRKLLDKTDVSQVDYNALLHHTVFRLKKITSLQLVFLQQGLHESPRQYYLRVVPLIDRLQGRQPDHVLAVGIAHYLNGIRNSRIQEALQTMTSKDELISLPTLGLQHRIIQLAYDYETALSRNLYCEEERPDLEKYIVFLRSCTADRVNRLAEIAGSPTTMNEETMIDTNRVRSLPDPTLLLHKPRDRYKDHLEFPKSDIGIQCDINFSAQLGLQNTLLLRCYSLSDSRVKLLILFIKYWARVRAINTPYRGSLSSYGYVLMVLHYLVHVAKPFVCPNLQELSQSPPAYLSPDEIAKQTTCNGYDVRFWRNEIEIAHLAERGMLNYNQDSPGQLLRGFFEYYAQTGFLSSGGKGFDWGREVLSLRTRGGLLTKQEKGWVGARTVTEIRTEAAPALAVTSTEPPPPPPSQGTNDIPASAPPRKAPVLKEEIKEIRHRYLFAIEDPFELDHNVARTVTHDGIVAIRDEFRRAWRIISSVGKPKMPQPQQQQEENILDEVVPEAAAVASSKSDFEELMTLLHGMREGGDATAGGGSNEALKRFLATGVLG